MSYLHEQRLAQARKMLYMLGNKPRSAPKKGERMEDLLEGAAGAGFGMAKSQSDGLKARQALAAAKNLEQAKFDKAARDETEDLSGLSDEDYKTYLNDVSVISGNGPRDFQGPAMPQGINWGTTDSIGEARDRLKVNAAARGAPISGQFTRQGAEQNKAEADNLTDDFHTADSLYQQGALMNKQADQQDLMMPQMQGQGQGMMGTRPVRFGGY